MEVLEPLCIPLSKKTSGFGSDAHLSASDDSPTSAFLDTSFWRIKSYGCVESTNLFIKDALAQGTEEGLCVVALQQSGGYGRQGHAWKSPLGGLYTSFALYPLRRGVTLDKLPLLSLVMSVALRRALRYFCDDSQLAIKWPNDVLFKGGKIAGISLEAVSGGVCVGIGINVFSFQDCAADALGKYRPSYVWDAQTNSVEGIQLDLQPDLQPGDSAKGFQPSFQPVDRVDDHQAGFQEADSAESLQSGDAQNDGSIQSCKQNAQDQPTDLNSSQRSLMVQLLMRMLYEVQQCYEVWCKKGFEEFLDEYRAHMAFVGDGATLEALDGSVFAEGTIIGVDGEGKLLIKTASGQSVAAHSGEVHVRTLRTAKNKAEHD